ncbi:hypothetical protein CERSUDRAFT_110034 [Gelatoporia subvermispora B]|uniref:BAH domain-containing protein n=1 Tax=Ceriporiopsis subvermispora (strain B) TaxID=914234 RepID=M2PX93_CERS8|nr:hypothetical protein CERSUDRAFT_110034 [Gelatoporia subvermispora B]
MPVTAAQKHAIEEVINALTSTTGSRGKRQLAEMFLELVDREHWPEYYEVIPEPRCINGVKTNLEKNKYKDPLVVYEDLNLVFLNALYYNEDGSQIAKDSATLQGILEAEWKQRSGVLPTPRKSPPPRSAQKVHGETSIVNAPEPGPSKQRSSPAPAKPSTRSAQATNSPATAASAAQATSAATAQAHTPDRTASPEMEVDVGGTPEPEVVANDTPRDPESDEIVRQLEKGLPRWEGFADVGWMEEVGNERRLGIVLGISKHTDASGTRLASTLEGVPEETTIPDLSFTAPLSLALIESRVRADHYASSKDFDKEMSQLFLKARRWYEPGSDAYGSVLVLQRLYHALTSLNPPSGPPYTSTTNFASLRAGPGTAKPLHTTDTEGVPGVTTFRVSTKDRTFVEEVHFKGWSVRLADWLHLSNPDDPSRPIIGQVFRCYISDETGKKGLPGVTVCWYYRPEQTFHPANRSFWEREVFKTSHFADHPLEDIIEKIACQFTARHIRGRPRPPYWYPGWPLYVCDSRYNDRERIFVKIKNWNSCVPEEVRKSTEFMPIYPFERSVFPRRFSSPFLSGKNVKGPGGIGGTIERGEGERIEGGGTGRRRPKRNATGAAVVTPSRSEQTDKMGPSKGLYVGPPTAAQPATPAVASASPYPAPAQTLYPRAQSTQSRSGGDRSIVAAAGGASANVLAEKLPPETAKHFDRDPETNEVLWFAAAPVDIAHPPGPRHSLAYLHYLAKKRKSGEREHDAMQIDGAESDVPSSKRVRVQPTATETLHALLQQFELPSPTS